MQSLQQETALAEATEYQRRYHSRLQIAVDRAVKQQVLTGIELLKEKYGEDWVDHIDLDSLRLSSATHCVLGQLYGDYGIGTKKLGIAPGTHEYGFTTKAEGDRAWRELDAAWIQEILYLRGLVPE